MPINTDVLKTVVELEGASQYVGQLRGIGRQAEMTAQQQLKLAEGFKRASTVMFAATAVGAGIVAGSVRAFIEQENGQTKKV